MPRRGLYQYGSYSPNLIKDIQSHVVTCVIMCCQIIYIETVKDYTFMKTSFPKSLSHITTRGIQISGKPLPQYVKIFFEISWYLWCRENKFTVVSWSYQEDQAKLMKKFLLWMCQACSQSKSNRVKSGN